VQTHLQLGDLLLEFGLLLHVLVLLLLPGRTHATGLLLVSGYYRLPLLTLVTELLRHSL
jgi:hypothetical protein